MRFPRVPTVLDQRLRVAITALLASREAAGEFAYVRDGSMGSAGLDRKVGPADADHAFGVGGPQVGDLAVSDHPRKRIGVVPGQLGGLCQSEELLALISKGAFDLQSGPLERAGPALGAEGLTELLGLGADFGDSLLNRAG